MIASLKTTASHNFLPLSRNRAVVDVCWNIWNVLALNFKNGHIVHKLCKRGKRFKAHLESGLLP